MGREQVIQQASLDDLEEVAQRVVLTQSAEFYAPGVLLRLVREIKKLRAEVNDLRRQTGGPFEMFSGR